MMEGGKRQVMTVQRLMILREHVLTARTCKQTLAQTQLERYYVKIIGMYLPSVRRSHKTADRYFCDGRIFCDGWEVDNKWVGAKTTSIN